jgi:phosphatidylglycerophosphatase C
LLALFDFDGTLTQCDTLFDLARQTVGPGRYYAGLASLAPQLAAHQLGWLTATAAKERFLRQYYQGWPAERFAQACAAYCAQHLPLRLRPAGLSRLKWHQEQGHRVCIVSASAEDWIRPWAEPLGIEVLATRLELRGGALTGQLASPNCNGPEKVARIKAHLDPGQYATIYAYGDSSGDREMLALAHQPGYRSFH